MIDALLIVVSYRSADAVASLLESVAASVEDLSWQLLVVNNDPDEDLATVAAADPTHVRVLEAGHNLGYAGGINLGLAAAPPSRWTVFLNPDIRLGAGSIARMAAASGDRASVVPTLVDDRGRVQPSLRREPSLIGAVGDALLGYRWARRPQVLSEAVLAAEAYAAPRAVDWATGAVLLVPTPIVEAVGPWDDRLFFLYSEETDYCRRLREAGCRILFLPSARVTHRGAGSGTSPALHALQEVNRVRYVRKWRGPGVAAAFTGVAVLANLRRAHRPEGRAALRALLLPSHRAALPGGPR